MCEDVCDQGFTCHSSGTYRYDDKNILAYTMRFCMGLREINTLLHVRTASERPSKRTPYQVSGQLLSRACTSTASTDTHCLQNITNDACHLNARKKSHTNANSVLTQPSSLVRSIPPRKMGILWDNGEEPGNYWDCRDYIGFISGLWGIY